MKPASSQPLITTLADVGYAFRRCSCCSLELPLSSKVEVFGTSGGVWIVAECAHCLRCTPFPLEVPA